MICLFKTCISTLYYENNVYIAMVNNSTNINKPNKHLDKQKREQRNMALEIQILAVDRHTSVARINRLL